MEVSARKSALKKLAIAGIAALVSFALTACA